MSLAVGVGFLLLFAVPVHGAESFGAAAASGFWAGFFDGFLSLFKLLLSPFLDVSVVGDVGTWTYTGGYYLGVLTFTGVAGAAASSEVVEPRVEHWATGRTRGD